MLYCEGRSLKQKKSVEMMNDERDLPRQPLAEVFVIRLIISRPQPNVTGVYNFAHSTTKFQIARKVESIILSESVVSMMQIRLQQ